MKRSAQQVTQVELAHARVDPALTAFDHLPDSSHVRLPVVCALFGCSKITVWRRVRNGVLPAPVKFSSRVTTWNVGRLREVLKRAV